MTRWLTTQEQIVAFYLHWRGSQTQAQDRDEAEDRPIEDAATLDGPPDEEIDIG